MIITKLKGGLGNQLFQAAAGLRLAHATKAELKIDVSELNYLGARSPRTYELDRFRFSAEIASPRDIAALRSPAPSRFWRWFDRTPNAESESSATERHFHFDPQVLSLPDNTCLDGYWQSERYFSDAASLVRREFEYKEPPAGRNAELMAKIESCHSVSLHVRRGDYASDPVFLAMHGLCPLDYYERAVKHVSERVSDPVFFLFSDDPDWVRANLNVHGAVEVVDQNGSDAGSEDLRLMSRCRHHIVANSTFSWWGAWLNGGAPKIVVAPQRWFSDESMNAVDLIPEAWVKL